MKFAHVLKANMKTELPSNYIFVDTETWFQDKNDLTFHNLKLGVAKFVRLKSARSDISEKTICFSKTREFWDAADKFCLDKTKTYLYAHNQHFDFFVLQGVTSLTALGWELKNFFVDSNIFMMRWKKENKTLEILDSGNILKTQLAEIGKALGLPKLEVDFNNVDSLKLYDYCERDVEILKRWMLNFREFIKEHDLGNYKKTIASQAFAAYRHRFMKQPIYIHNNKQAIKLERESYFGGRTEAFSIGILEKQNYTLLDVNSMYPFIMRNNAFPTMLLKHIKNPSPAEFFGYLKKFGVIAKCQILTTEPVFPIRSSKALFPIGEFETVLNTPELQYASENGMILEVKEMNVYQMDSIFTEYIDFFYNLKKRYKEEKNGAMYLLSKLFMNSLYGKFGQKSTIYKFIEKCDPSIQLIISGGDAITYKPVTDYFLAGKHFRSFGESESFDTFVAVASHVTAYARLYLWRLIKTAGMENVFYCDTDSLLVNQKGLYNLKKFIDSRELGMLDSELESENIIIRGPKDYDFGVKKKLKGIKNNAENLGNNTFRQEQFLKFRTLMRSGLTQSAIVKRVVKHLQRKYDKGKVLKSGRVAPYSLPEDAAFF